LPQQRASTVRAERTGPTIGLPWDWKVTKKRDAALDQLLGDHVGGEPAVVVTPVELGEAAAGGPHATTTGPRALPGVLPSAE
jgi:hypothetical protein